MNTLAFDCSTEDIYLFLKTDEKEKSVCLKDTKSTEFLVQKIDDLLKEFNFPIAKIDCIGVGIGPGSFTGARVAVATAKAIALVIKCKLFVFNSFDMISFGKEEDAVFVVKGFSSFVYARGKNIEPCCLDVDELEAKLSNNTKIYANFDVFDKKNVIIAKNELAPVVNDKLNKKDFIELSELEPLYLRASQAEIELEKRKKQ